VKIEDCGFEIERVCYRVMIVPDQLPQQLFQFANKHYNGTGLMCSASEMGIACQQIAAEFCVSLDGTPAAKGLDCDGLVAWSGRFGMCLGKFFISEKEG